MNVVNLAGLPYPVSGLTVLTSRLITGAIGIIVLLAVAFALSYRKRAIRPRIVLTALFMQAAIGVAVLDMPAGKATVGAIAVGVQGLMAYSNSGIDMLFGDLASPKFGNSLAIHMLPVIVFFAALSSMLYYLKIMQLATRLIGGAFGIILGVDRVEALTAAANVLVGQSESPLVIRPHLGKLSQAQLFAVMTCGMAGVAGTILAAYAQLGVSLDYLLAASFMSAPGGLLMAKIIMPDVGGGEELNAPEGASTVRPGVEAEGAAEPNGLIMAIANGAQDGVKVAVGVGAMIIAFVALIAMFNGILGWAGTLFHVNGLSLQLVLGYAFAPVMYLINIPWGDARTAGALFGERLITNEFVAYLHLMGPGVAMQARSKAILTFALCGFANLGSIAIQLAVIGGLAPNQRKLIVRYGPRALAAATLANLMNAAIAGILLA